VGVFSRGLSLKNIQNTSDLGLSFEFDAYLVKRTSFFVFCFYIISTFWAKKFSGSSIKASPILSIIFLRHHRSLPIGIEILDTPLGMCNLNIPKDFERFWMSKSAFCPLAKTYSSSPYVPIESRNVIER
jgi:hypothetical protein